MTQKQEKMLAVGTMGLLASVFGNIALSGANNGLKARNDSLKQGEATLRNLLTDWQQAYQEIDAQLSQAMRLNAELHRANDELGIQVADLRRARDQARAEAYKAGQLAIELQTSLAAQETALRVSECEVAELKAARAAHAHPKESGDTKAASSSSKRTSAGARRKRSKKKATSGGKT